MFAALRSSENPHQACQDVLEVGSDFANGVLGYIAGERAGSFDGFMGKPLARKNDRGKHLYYLARS